MAWTKYQYILALTLVVTGSLNTLTTKWADKVDSVGKDDVKRRFDHPFVQACAMFLGELMCLILFKMLFFYYRRKADGSVDSNDLVKGNRDFNPFFLYIPAMCDMLATSIMYIGLNLTYASSFQMLRGSVIVFTGLLSVAFLNRTLSTREWSGISFIIMGLAVVGVSDFMSNDSSAGSSFSRNSIITGDLLIIIAQVIQSVQMVYEERYVAGLDIPALQAVGWEGFYGFFVLSILLVPMYYIKVGAPFGVSPEGNLEDFVDAIVQIKNSWQLILSFIGTFISIAFFNFAGISVTKEISATTRMVLDSVRTLVIWVVALALGWQNFHSLQVLGFVSLLFGMCLYNNVFILQTYGAVRRAYLRRRYGEMTNEIIVNREADDPSTA